MADDKENIQIQVPAFTVLKNGSIIKNIFLLSKQNSTPNQESILLVGRHPHCNITLEHPSISRHHLRIHSNPSLQLISVVDLSSVHGTWVSGKRIEPGVIVGLKEGDTVKMGSSSRVYELHWVPLSQSYDVDGRFLSTISDIKEGEKEMNQDEKLETQLSDHDLECWDLSLPDKIHDSPLKTLSLATSLDPEYFRSLCDDTELEQSNSSKTDDENGEIISTILVPSPLVSGTISPIEDSDSLSESEDQRNLLGDNLSNDFMLQNHGLVKKDLVSVSNCSESSCGVTEVEDSSSPKTSNGNCLDFSSVSVHAPTPPVVSRTTSATDISDGLKELEDPLNWLKDNLSNEFDLQSHGIIREDLCSVPNCSIFACNGSEAEHWIPWNIGNKDSRRQDISSSLNKSEDWSNWLRDNLSNEFEQLIHGTSQDDLISVNNHDAIKMHEKDVFNQNMSRSDENEPLDEQEFDNGSLPVALSKAVIRDEAKYFMLDGPRDNEINVGCEFEQMTQTKMTNQSASEVLFEGVDSKVEDDVLSKPKISGEEEVVMGDKFESIDHEIMKEKSVFEVLSNETDMDQEQTFSPGISRAKEVHTNLEAMKNVLVLINPLDGLDGYDLELFTPDKENKNPNACSGRSLEKTWKEDRNCCTMSTEAVANFQGEENKRWTMIVDTNTLVHGKSLKHLKLLKGLKGTQLLVPKIVITELMEIKNHDNLLKRREKKVSLALKWIDECLVNAKWWIHMEDEITNSSEVESQVLETAICLRKKVTDGKFVILSNDLSLKIKAMAEGIMCETSEEFRWSLVNPFSERFMWVGSSAIGLTWSSVDDDAVKSQKYHGCRSNGSHELKGLKLLAYVKQVSS